MHSKSSVVLPAAHFVTIVMDDEDDQFIGCCLIEGCAWRRNTNTDQPWSVRRRLVPTDSAASIGTRFRHCSAPPMLMLLANRIELLFDDDDDNENLGKDSTVFVAVYTYFRDYSDINRVELSSKQKSAIARSMQLLEKLLPEIRDLKQEIRYNLVPETKQNNNEPATSNLNHLSLLQNGFTAESRDSNDRGHQDGIQLKQEGHRFVSPDRSMEDDYESEDDWNDDSGWATVTSLAAPREREIVSQDEAFTVRLNRDVEVRPDVHNLHLSSVFPSNDLSSDSEVESDCDDPNRQFAPEWGAVAFLPDGVPSDTTTVFPRQGTEIDKRPLGDLFHENSLDDDAFSTHNNHSRSILQLTPAPKRLSSLATPLLVKNNQKKYLLFERTVNVPKIELSMPYRPWKELRDEVYSNSSTRPFQVQSVAVDDGLEQASGMDMDIDKPPAIISVPITMDQSLCVPFAMPPKPAVAKAVQERRRTQKLLPTAALDLLRRHISEALLTYAELKDSIFGTVGEGAKAAAKSKRIETRSSSSMQTSAAPKPSSQSLSQAQVDVKPVINHAAPQSASSSSRKVKEKSDNQSKPSKRSNSSNTISNSRLLSANPISIDACLRAGHNYLQLLMTWIQKNYPQVKTPSDTIGVKSQADGFIATFNLKKAQPPLKIQAVSHSNSKKAARHQIARQSVLYIQKRKLGDTVKFNQRRVDSRFDKLALSTISSSEDDDSDTASSMDLDSPAFPEPASQVSSEPVFLQPEREILASQPRPAILAPLNASQLLRPESIIGSSLPEPPRSSQAEPIVRIKREPPDPVLQPTTSPRKRDFVLMHEPPNKRVRSEREMYSSQSQHQGLSAPQTLLFSGLISTTSVSGSNLSQDHADQYRQVGSSSNLVNKASSFSFIEAPTDVSEYKTQAPSSFDSLVKAKASQQADYPQISRPSGTFSDLTSVADKSDFAIQAHLSISDGRRPKPDPISAVMEPEVSSSVLEARSFLDSLRSPSSTLCIAKKPGDPFIIYLDDESHSDEEFESKQSKLNSIKTELMLLKSKLGENRKSRGFKDSSKT